MLHAYVERFDVMGERGNILGCDGEVNKVMVYICHNLSADCSGCLRLSPTRNPNPKWVAET
jgi:hypothetical protein